MRLYKIKVPSKSPLPVFQQSFGSDVFNAAKRTGLSGTPSWNRQLLAVQVDLADVKTSGFLYVHGYLRGDPLLLF